MAIEINGSEAHHSTWPAAGSKPPPIPMSKNDILNFIKQGQKCELMPTIIDHNASHHPQKVFASIPMDNNDLSKGFRDVTYVELSKAVDKAAFWLEEKLGPAYNEATNNADGPGQAPKSTFPTFAFYGTRDLRYSIFVLAAMKAGYKVGRSCDFLTLYPSCQIVCSYTMI